MLEYLEATSELGYVRLYRTRFSTATQATVFGLARLGIEPRPVTTPIDLSVSFFCVNFGRNILDHIHFNTGRLCGLVGLERGPLSLVSTIDRLCGLVLRVPGYRSRGPGSIAGATRFSEK
jgi:hypothetical protein